MYICMLLTSLPIFINTRFCFYQPKPSSNSASCMCLVSYKKEKSTLAIKFQGPVILLQMCKHSWSFLKITAKFLKIN